MRAVHKKSILYNQLISQNQPISGRSSIISSLTEAS